MSMSCPHNHAGLFLGVLAGREKGNKDASQGSFPWNPKTFHFIILSEQDILRRLPRLRAASPSLTQGRKQG